MLELLIGEKSFLSCLWSRLSKHSILLFSHLESLRQVWKWRGSTWGTFSTTITPNVACGTGECQQVPGDLVTCICTMTSPRLQPRQREHFEAGGWFLLCNGNTCWRLERVAHEPVLYLLPQALGSRWQRWRSLLRKYYWYAQSIFHWICCGLQRGYWLLSASDYKIQCMRIPPCTMLLTKIMICTTGRKNIS